MIFRLQGFFD